MNFIEKSLNKKKFIPLDHFIDLALYKKNLGYYQKKKKFGRDGDFVTSPIISSIFSEMISVWFISYWIHLKKPKKINILELGPGNGTMIKQIISATKKFKTFDADLMIYLHEKSEKLKRVQKNNLEKFNNIFWVKNINKINKYPTVIIANEFFDAFPIKQFFKKKGDWYEQCITFSKKKNPRINYCKRKTNNSFIKKYSNFYNLNKSKVIEYPTNIDLYIKAISKIIKNNKGIFLMLDYGYSSVVGKNTVRAIKDHKIVNLLKNYTNCDITSDVNFNILKNFFNKNNIKNIGNVTQSFFLQKMGIMERAEQVIKKNGLLYNKDLILSMNKLLNPKEMGNVFHVLSFGKKDCKFNLGFI
jgi:cyclopropane-fatty-acyl-phospholipid synthase